MDFSQKSPKLKVINIIASPRKNKRFRAVLSDNSTVDFGLLNGFTYLDGASNEVKENYKKRHYNSSKEKALIDNLVISPSTLSWFLIWGDYRDINKNMKVLNKLLS
jgi:hypothetical protein